jgi:hypothetical protein
MGSYEDEERRRELFQLIRDVSEVEEIPMAAIRELSSAHVIDITNYHKAWEALCAEGWKVVEIAEERMEACDEI